MSISVPRTLAVGRSVTDGRLRVPKTGFVLSHLALAWRGDAAMVRVRDQVGWTDWQLLGGCAGGRDGMAAGGQSVLVVPGGTGYEVVVTGDGTARLTELNTVDGPALPGLAEPAGPVSGMPLPDGTICPVTYLSRAAWGADESLRFAGPDEIWPAEYFPVQALTVHHTDGINDDPDPAATVRAIYYHQGVGLGWGDIGYHLLVDEAGRVYEGRWTGDDTVPVFGPGSLMINTAGHALSFNPGNIGVVYLGSFTSRLPTAAAQNAMAKVLAALARVGRVNPQGTVTYVRPDSPEITKTVFGVSGHRDWNATQCPGNTYYPALDALRATVAALLPEVVTVPRVRNYPLLAFPGAPSLTGRVEFPR